MAKRRFGIGLFIGALAGLATGLLTAPKSGKETRADIKKKAGEVKDEATHAAGQAKKKADEIVREVKHKAGEARSLAKDVAEEAKDKAEAVRDRVESAVESAKKAAEHELNKPDAPKPPRAR